ncbi:phenylacetic acid degradation protein PaaI [Aquimarina atlantica]|uniref:Medium/long-chain acyl-CoA thioesterase YigI n=1 Tax=Aquimarina atlantica TaxID=1317122 RepID=A0A023BW71_9FLAO|nr:PaaI family thioesterase [Aquimarina atlantica]EZH74256.1 phenylacetic acid degradation protein PaaI [Aquimarina atlantica]
MKFEPKSDTYKKKVKESFERQEFMKLINAQLIDVRPGYCEIHVPYHSSLTQQHGFFHAGIISTIADNAAGYAGFSLMEENSSVLTVEFKINLMAPGDGELLIGKSNVLKNGRTLTICTSEVFISKNGVEKLCAAAQLTLIELKNSSDQK